MRADLGIKTLPHVEFSKAHGYLRTETFSWTHIGTKPLWVTASVWRASQCWDVEPAISIFVVFNFSFKIISEISSLYSCKTYLLNTATLLLPMWTSLMHSSKQQTRVWADTKRKEKAVVLPLCKSTVRKERQLRFSLLVSRPIACPGAWWELFQGNSWWVFHYWSFKEKYKANKDGRTVLCTSPAPSDRELLKESEFTQVLPLLRSITILTVIWRRNPPLWVQTGDVSLWHIGFRECSQRNDRLFPFSPPHSTDCLEHSGVHPAEPWLPLPV